MSEEQLPSAPSRRYAAIGVKIAVSAALLALLFSRIDVDRLWAGARNASLSWLAIALLLYFANVLAGIWLLVAPYVLPGLAPAWNEIVCGAVIFVLALTPVTVAWRVPALSYVNAAMGTALTITGFWSNATTGAVVGDVLVGLAVVLLALLSANARP